MSKCSCIECNPYGDEPEPDMNTEQMLAEFDAYCKDDRLLILACDEGRYYPTTYRESGAQESVSYWDAIDPVLKSAKWGGGVTSLVMA